MIKMNQIKIHCEKLPCIIFSDTYSVFRCEIPQVYVLEVGICIRGKFSKEVNCKRAFFRFLRFITKERKMDACGAAEWPPLFLLSHKYTKCH